MHYGLQISASGALASMYRQDVFANNLANLEAVGFKPDIPGVMARDAASVEDGLGLSDSSPLLERLGAGVLAAPTRVSFAQGPLESTGRALDVAIEGDGFFVVRDQNAGSGVQIRLTRDGRFALNSQRQLVMANSGLPVLDQGNRPITLPGRGNIEIATDGTISQNGAVVAQIQVADVPNKDVLRKNGGGLFTPSPSAIRSLKPIHGHVRAGMLEQSAVNEISAMMDVSAAAKQAQSNLGMITYHDRLMDQAINTFGRSA